MQLPVNQLDAAADTRRRLAAGVRLERALEVVHQRQQLLDDARGRRVGQRLPIALDALAVVVELGRLPQQQIVELVALALQLGRIRWRWPLPSSLSAALEGVPVSYVRLPRSTVLEVCRAVSPRSAAETADMSFRDHAIDGARQACRPH